MGFRKAISFAVCGLALMALVVGWGRDVLAQSYSRSGAPPGLVADGTVSLPGLAFASEPSSGWYRTGAGSWRGATLGNSVIQFNAFGNGSQVFIPATTGTRFVTQTDATTNNFEVRGGGTTNRGVLFPDYTFANLPTSPPNGLMLYCNDCNATCSAGASTGKWCARTNGAWVAGF